jgi:hypothetical protein
MILLHLRKDTVCYRIQVSYKECVSQRLTFYHFSKYSDNLIIYLHLFPKIDK